MRGILIAVLVLTAGAFATAEDEWVRPYDPYLPGTEPLDDEGGKKVVAVRLVRREGASIGPVAGGRVSCWTEETLNLVPAARLVAEATTDEFGIANLRPVREGGQHWHFEGPGCGSVHEFHAFATWSDGQVTLGPGIDVPVEILDPFGKPLVGADVEVHLGCPHSPALRRGTTGRRGEITFRDIADPWAFRFWIRAPGVDFGPYDLDHLTIATNGRFRVITQPAMAVRGRVLDETGEPFPGVVVRCHGWALGPRVVTDEAGRFVLHGVIGDAVCFHDPRQPFGDRPSCVVRHYEPDFPLLVRLRKDRPTSMGDGEVRHHTEVLVKSAMPSTDGGEYLSGENGVLVRLVRTSDGLVLTARSGRDQTEGKDGNGLASFEAPPGEYRVLAGGGFEVVPPMKAMLRVPRETPAPVRLRFPYSDRQPYPRMTHGGPGIPETGTLHLPGSSRIWGKSERLPSAGVAVLFTEDPVPWVTRAGEADGNNRGFTWRGPEPTRIQVRFDPPDPALFMKVHLIPRFGTWHGEPEEGTREPDGGWSFRTFSAGPAVISVTSETSADPWHLVTLPSEPGRRVDLGVVKLRPRRDRVVRIVAPAGVAGIRRLDETWGPCFMDDGEAENLEGNRFTWTDSERPCFASLLLEEEEESPFHWVTPLVALGPDTPDEIRVSAGRITAAVTGPDGPMPVVVFLDHDEFTFEDGKIDIRGVADGPHILIVGARKHRGEVRRIVIRDGETRALEIRLPRRITKR